MKKVIAIIWRISSWKDYAWDFLEKNFWWKHVWISSSLRIIARERGISEQRENLIAIWKELAQKYGDAYLAEILVTKEESNFLIISGPRQLWQLEYLRNHTNCMIVGIDATEEVRYNRILKRWKIGENLSLEDFKKIEKLDEGKIQNVWKCLELCDFIIENNKSLKKFEDELTRISYWIES